MPERLPGIYRLLLEESEGKLLFGSMRSPTKRLLILDAAFRFPIDWFGIM